MTHEVCMVQQNGPSRFYCAAVGCGMWMLNDENIFCQMCNSQLPEPPIKNGYTSEGWRQMITDQRRKEHVHGFMWMGTTTTTPSPVSTTTPYYKYADIFPATDGLGNPVPQRGCMPQQDATRLMDAFQIVRRQRELNKRLDAVEEQLTKALDAVEDALKASAHLRTEIGNAQGR